MPQVPTSVKNAIAYTFYIHNMFIGHWLNCIYVRETLNDYIIDLTYIDSRDPQMIQLESIEI